MKFQLFGNRTTTRVAALAMCSLLIGGSAYAVTSAAFRYPAPKNGYLAISNLALAPADNSGTAEYGNSPTNGLATLGPRCFNTGLNLPNGAKLVNATVWYSSGNTGNVKFLIYRRRLSDGDIDSVVNDTIINDNSGTYKGRSAPVDPFAEIVQNSKYAIGFQVCLDADNVFYGARVYYTYTTAGD